MEAASAPSSKVTVQCTDPSKVLEVFESRFTSRTPLKSLHWKSPTRPLRSISSLNVALVPNDGSPNGLQTSARRHQIPGLRETPYVKLYLLRCDDKEKYKETARKEIKQWIKDNTLEKESKSSLRNQEHHDAFEWMIVHIVMPNTPAASQPKTSKHISLETTDSTDSVNSKSKWTGKSPSTIFDKLRADFGSSKSAVPRVAQVRIIETGKPTSPFSPAEIEEEWVEFVDGLKACILKSFSTRVAQYEEDIREREAQRSLPGWNFCTFFVLKEGLARGFESIGLVEDSLGVYSELEVGLDNLVKESASRDEIDSAGLLLFSQDLKGDLRQALDETEDDSAEASGRSMKISLDEILASPPDHRPFDLQRRQYRDLILRNQVSALDLRIYIFARRMELILAQVSYSYNSSSSARSLYNSKDLDLLAELMELSLEFITSASRELRSDLIDAYGGRLVGRDRTIQSIIIGNMAASWTWSAIMQVLAIARPALSSKEFSTTVPINNFSREASRPQTPSEQNASSTASSPQRKYVTFSEVRPSSNGVSVPSQANPSHHVAHGVNRLAAWTARLILLARATLEDLRSCQPWAAELHDLEVSGIHAAGRKPYAASATDLLQSSEEKDSRHSIEDNRRSLQPSALRFATANDEHFYTVYDFLSQIAYNYLGVAGALRAAQQVLLDIASLAFHRGDIEAAGKSLQKLVDLHQQDDKFQLQPYALALYAQCLQSLDRPEEYANCLLECLRCPRLNQLPENAQGYLDEFLRIASTATVPTMPLNLLVEFSGCDRGVSHSLGRGGFFISLVLRSRVAATYMTESPINLILKASDKQDPSKIVLRSSHNVEISPAGKKVSFWSTVTTTGWYDLHSLEIQVGKLSLSCSMQDIARGNIQDRMNLSRPDLAPPALFLYPQSDAPSLDLSPSQTLFLGETRKLEIKIRSPKYPTSNYALRLRAGTAGLRLRVLDAKVLDKASEIEIARDNDLTLLRWSYIEPGHLMTIEMPYALESPSDVSVSVKCEVSYEAEGQTYTLFETCSADIILPISVNVQDMYRPSYWFSRFHVSPSTLVPVVVLGCTIQDDPDVSVEGSSAFEEPLIVFPHQPAHWTIRLTSLKKDRNATATHKIHLIVRYKALDAVILNSLKNAFNSDLDEAGFSEYRRPLLSHLMQTVKAGWTEQDLEVAGLTQEMDVWHQKDLDWSSLLCGFDRSANARLNDWLEQWHQTRATLPLDFSSAPVRSLKLAVELPPRPPVITTALTILTGLTNAGVAVLGQPLVCGLSVTKSMPDERSVTETEFRFELFTHADAWLIGGRKKGRLPANQTSLQYQVVLFPQKLGATLLPVIDIRCQRKKETEADPVETPIEVHNRTVSTTVEVSQNLQSTTIGLGGDEGLQLAAGTLLSTRPREEG